MKWIIFSGIDGCGKSTLLAGVKKQLLAENLVVSEQWLRFHHVFCKGLHAFSRCIGLSRKVKRAEGSVWHHEFYRSRLFCYIYIYCTYFDTVLGRRAALKHAKNAHADIVLCDRWIPDILVDLAVACHNPDMISGIWKERFMKLLPEDTLLFCIIRPESELLACRTENREDNDFAFRQEMYRKWIEFSNSVVVENNSTIDATVASIKKLI